MGAGPGADAQYVFAEDVLGHTAGHRPRHSKTYRNFALEYERLQKERISAFKEFIADVNSGAYPAPEHTVPIGNEEFKKFMSKSCLRRCRLAPGPTSSTSASTSASTSSVRG